MKVTPVSENKTTKTCKNIGTSAGFTGYVANVAIKEGKDIFAKAGREAVEKGLSSKVGVAVKAGSIGLIAAGFAVGGRIIGGLIGKAIDKHNEKKQSKELLEKAIQTVILEKDIEPISIKEMKKELNIKD